MNDPLREAEVLTQEIRNRFSRVPGSKIQIRAAAGPNGLDAAERLLTALRLGGLNVELHDDPSEPRGDLLIETAHESAMTALALQSSFLAIGMQAQLLVHPKSKPKVIVLHLGTQG